MYKKFKFELGQMVKHVTAGNSDDVWPKPLKFIVTGRAFIERLNGNIEEEYWCSASSDTRKNLVERIVFGIEELVPFEDKIQ